MRHLFIINPAAEKLRGRVAEVEADIRGFFLGYGQLEYDIHVTRWVRDASAFAHRYVQESGGLVRVHCMGGNATLFEAVNGVIGLPNAQIATYPLGRNNSFVRYFGADKTHLFASLRNQVFSDVIPVDVLRCGGNYAISYGVVGLEAESTRLGTEMIERSHLRSDLYYILPTAVSGMKRKRIGRSYKISLDGTSLDGDYATMLIANVPCYGKSMNPAIDAHPNDGLLDLYLIREVPKIEFISLIPKYINGHYDKAGGAITHHTGKRLTISSDSVMDLALDGETFFENSAEYEILPRAVDLVCPQGVDPKKLPRLFGRPEEGCVNAQ